MVALNPEFAPSQTEADTREARQRVDGEPKASPKDGLKRVPEVGQFEPQNRVGKFFSLAAQSVGVDRFSSRNRIGENRVYAYETASVDTEYEYSPFGEVVRSFGSYADANAFRFSTKYLDAETGFYYYGYRHYDPATGRWLNRDPLGERGGINLYAMVVNDPIGQWDYLGLQGPEAHAGKGGRRISSGTDAQRRNTTNNVSTVLTGAALVTAPYLPLSLPLGAFALITDIVADSDGDGDNDNDGIPDVDDTDDDNDGIPDENDEDPLIPDKDGDC